MTLAKRFILLVFIFSIGSIISSCSTEKDALINRGYHNMTAHYNGYFNANLLIDEAMESFRNSVIEDYNEFLPPDLYPGSEDVPGLLPNIDTAISKCTKVIVKHSMPNAQKAQNKSDEHCRWIDDNWFVIGYACFLKRDYPQAIEKLKYVSESPMYNGEKAVYISRIYLARSYTAIGDYRAAKATLKIVGDDIDRQDSEKGSKEKDAKPKSKYQKKKLKKKKKEEKKEKPAKFPKKWKVDYEVAMAEMFMAEKKYKNAIEHLQNAVTLCKKRKRKARYMYVLAQLYQEVGDGSQASYWFAKVSNSNAPYIMQFQAKINKALAATTGTESIVKELRKMLRDPKNAEFKDQIYYALAELEIKNKNIPRAKEYYTASILWSVKNKRQKGVSYLRLGDLSFGEKDYISAQKYYDSCVQVLPEDYDGYIAIKAKADGLTDLVFHYETVVFEDSVQRIAGMSEKEMEKYLEKTLKKMQDDERIRKEEEQRRLLEQQNRVNSNVSNAQSGSKWYFYNQKVKGSGFNDFRAQWGQRVLEDNWRRSNKSSLAEFVDEDGDSSNVSSNVDSMTVDDLRKNLPLTDDDMIASNDRLLNSMYMLGIIYKEQLQELGEAEVYFKKVVNHGIEHPKVLPALYQLYLMKKGSGGDQYKDRILRDYPDSEIAQIIADPDFLKRKEEKEKEDLVAYENTYEKYRFRKYKQVLSDCDTVIKYDSTNQFLKKYYLLKAFALSYLKSGNKQIIAQPLKDLIALSPESEEGKQAKIYLGLLNAGQNINGGNSNQPVEPNYVLDENQKHYYVVVFNTGDPEFAKCKIKLSNFNMEYFRMDNLEIVSSPLGSGFEILRVKSFENAAKAKVYADTYKSTAAQSALNDMAFQYTSFAISIENFKEMTKFAGVESYNAFYEQNYP